MSVSNSAITFTHGAGNTLVILLTMQGEQELSESVFRIITGQLPSADFTIAVYECSDWDGDFSPWQYCMTGGRFFSGNGRSTLEHIIGNLSTLVQNYRRIYIAGYSLAGLFALWSLHETDLFDGCACCSGSLWFEGWEEYAKTHTFHKPSNVYLSLGGKESKIIDPVVSTIEGKTKNEDKRLSQNSLVKKHTLVMNPGGHFASPGKRLAQGIVWLLQNNH